MFNQKRIRELNEEKLGNGPVLYWMSRDQRVEDNWALLYAQKLARENKKGLMVCFCLLDDFLEAQKSHYSFMLRGLKQVSEELKSKNIPLHLLKGNPGQEISKFVNEYNLTAVVSDFSPLKIAREWKKEILERIESKFFEVDAHNIVPCWIASPKKEYAARTFRPKIKDKLKEFLEPIPELKKQDKKREQPIIKWEKLTPKENAFFEPGTIQANKILEKFIQNKLEKYPEQANNPNKRVLSNLSPYLHFGQISSQKIAIKVRHSKINQQAKEAFLEELIVRKELSDNFCYYEQDYDSFQGFPEWAKKTLKEHEKDKREYEYSLSDFEKAKTHDDLWNAAQRQMIRENKMHGYMRMYWAKKILEWTSNPVQALKITQSLNDKYELDGRDPNGFVGVAWSIGGVHDRAWKERPVFGKIRFMSYNGCKRKFDVQKYIQKYT